MVKRDEKMAALFSKGLQETPAAQEVRTIQEAPPRPKAAPVARPVGRPAGKKSSQDYEQKCFLLRTDTMEDVEDALTVERRQAKRRGEKGRDFSELVQELLEQWLIQNKART
jgi:hypothetical protein